MFSVLQVRPFRYLWSGQLLSQWGNAAFAILGLWVLQAKDPFLLAIAGLAVLLPSSLSMIGGVLADRMDSRRIMFWPDAARGVAVLVALGVAAWDAALIPAAIIAVMFVNSLGGATFGPAEMVVLPTLVSDDQRASANGLMSFTWQSAGVVGSALGGAALAVLGVAAVMGLDVASFFISAACILAMAPARADAAVPSGPPENRTLKTRSAWLGDIREGWATLKQMRWFLTTLPFIVLANFLGNGGFTMMAYWVHHDLHSTVKWFGFMEGAWAGGMLVGSLLVGLLRRYSIPHTVGVLMVAQSAFTALFALAAVPVWSVSFLMVAGILNGLSNALLFAFLQQAIPDPVRGRVMGIFLTLISVMNPLGTILAGLTLPYLFWWFISESVGTVILGILLFFTREFGLTATAPSAETA